MSNIYLSVEYIWTGLEVDSCVFTKGKSYFTDKDGFITTDLGSKVDPKHYSKLEWRRQKYVCHVDEYGMVRSPNYDFVIYGGLKGSYGGRNSGGLEGENVDENDKEVADRHNDGKPEMSYVLQGPKGLDGLAKVLEFGSRKYYRGNWLKGFPDTSLIDSMMRHLTAYISGEILDPESGLPHIDHIHANAKFLAEHGDRNEK